MKIKYTPGPWEHGCGYDGATVYAVDVGTVAHCPIDLSDYADNARLIAAAPELLDVAEAIVTVFRSTTNLTHIEKHLLDGAKHAISKAKGEA